ncbi:MAG: hypothetical protein DRH12_09815 [Deltaproteobacteria bacterium]|uniref:Uncharacterized protein n=1 Tax=Thermosulfidibacter takaii TaxID=412593 RepID=A0A7C0Y8J8_9BACT|nr:MAG: hypothetical protein DRH12_09815 [Deltaproteobacteria bacterium]HDD53106.1 hypothetical protein [Thermosulfidibacter takaii]
MQSNSVASLRIKAS